MLKNSLGCENLCMKLSHFIYHLIVACSENNAPVFTAAHGICVPDKRPDMRISNFIIYPPPPLTFFLIERFKSVLSKRDMYSVSEKAFCVLFLNLVYVDLSFFKGGGGGVPRSSSGRRGG